MAQTKRAILRRIEVSTSVESLQELENEIDFNKFEETDKEEIYEALQAKTNEILQSTPKRVSIEKSTSDLPFDPSLYDRDDSTDKPSYKNLCSPNQTHIEFLKEVFFKEFIELPSPDIQIPVLISLFFQNSMTIPDKCRLPMVYIYSPKEDSGKSTLLYHMMNYYHPKLR